MDQYATHQEALVGAVMRTSGPVLELGAGDYSTPILHEICRAQGRALVTLEYRWEWLEKFDRFRSATHLLFHVKDWARADTIDKQWSVAFVDHAPGERRKIELERLRLSRTRYVVIHDTEPNPIAGYGLEPVLARFKYRRDFSEKIPWTTVVSDDSEIWR